MNNKALSIVKNFSYTIFSNLISLISASLVILIIPKLIGVEEYGYWQLYLFYSTYVGVMHFGWNDGIYLRYGGKKYEELDKSLFFSQFWMLVFTQIIIFIIIFLFASVISEDLNRVLIIQMTLICMVIVNVRRFLQYVLLGTNRIKEFSNIIISDRVLYIILITLFLLVGVRDFELLIVADLIGKFISLFYATYSCRDIVFRKISTFTFQIIELFNNISVGINLMFANIASILVIGIVRFGIDRAWGVSTFGKVSLTLSISNLVMIFINAIGIVLFPVLRRTNKQKLPEIYLIVRSFLMVLLFGLMIINYPLKTILLNWLPEYASSLKYIAMIFPMVVFEGKMVLLINTYLKTLREEKFILRVNLLTLLLSVILTIITTMVLKNLDLTVLCIVILLCFRSVFAELYLCRILNINLLNHILWDIFITIIFIFTTWNFNTLIATFLYLIIYGLYLMVKRSEITHTIQELKVLMKK